MGNYRSTSYLTTEMKKAHTAFLEANKENVMTLNNQNTILLEYQRILIDDQAEKTKIISFILHDNRIYVFERFIARNNHHNFNENNKDLEMAITTTLATTLARSNQNQNQNNNNTHNGNKSHTFSDDNSDPSQQNPLFQWGNNHPNRKESNVSMLSTDITATTGGGGWKELQQGKEIFDTAVSTPAKDLIQNILTSPGFRLLSFMYLFFQLVDDSTFIAIIASTIYTGATSNSSPTGDTYSLYFVIGLEIFYDILLAVNKYWILQRLSLYIGITLFIAYFTLLNEIYQRDGISNARYETLTYLLIFRLFFFIFEECVDIYIDCSIHNILLTSQHCRDNNIHVYQGIGQSMHLYHSVICNWYFRYANGNYQCQLCSDYTLPRTWFPSNILNVHEKRMKHIHEEHANYLDHIETKERELLKHQFRHAKCMIPEAYSYKGSFFAWTFYSMYCWENEDPAIFHEDDFNQFFSEWRHVLILFPAILTAVIAFAVGIFAFGAIAVMIVLLATCNFLLKSLRYCCWYCYGDSCFPYRLDLFNFKLFRYFLKELKRI